MMYISFKIWNTKAYVEAEGRKLSQEGMGVQPGHINRQGKADTSELVSKWNEDMIPVGVDAVMKGEDSS